MSRQSGNAEPFADYPAAPADEAVTPDGRLRTAYAFLRSATDLTAVAAATTAEHAARGVAVAAWADGRQVVRPFPLDPVPRIVPVAEWRVIAAGVEQRHRALNAFLADVYRAAGRRRGDVDRAPQVVTAGVLPEWAVAHNPARDPDAVGLAWAGQPRATVAGADVVRTAAGDWVVTADHLRVPAGLGYALAARDAVRGAAPELLAAGAAVADPYAAVPLLAAGLATAAPPECEGPPRIAVLTAGESDNAWSEHRLLADALGVPLVRAGELWPRIEGGVEAAVGGERLPIDVLYRRFDDGLLGAYRTPIGQSLDVLLAEAVRAGRLGLANVPGNALADDLAIYGWVPELIRFYLGEEPLLGSVRTWVLADEAQWAEVRDRLHELVVRPVAGYGGRETVVGPLCSAAELAFLQAEVAAAPYRFVAQEPVPPTTVPTLVDGRLQPWHSDLRVLSVSGPGNRATALPAPLTRVVESPEPAGWWSGGSKDTWIVG